MYPCTHKLFTPNKFVYAFIGQSSKHVYEKFHKEVGKGNLWMWVDFAPHKYWLKWAKIWLNIYNYIGPFGSILSNASLLAFLAFWLKWAKIWLDMTIMDQFKAFSAMFNPASLLAFFFYFGQLLGWNIIPKYDLIWPLAWLEAIWSHAKNEQSGFTFGLSFNFLAEKGQNMAWCDHRGPFGSIWAMSYFGSWYNAIGSAGPEDTFVLKRGGGRVL